MKNLPSRREFMAGATAAAALAWTANARGQEAAPGEHPWRIGIYTRPWNEYDYREALDAIAEAGYEAVGVMSGDMLSADTTPEEAAAVGEECRQRGLSIPSAYAFGYTVQESREAGVTILRRMIDCCEAAGIEDLLMGGTGNFRHHTPYYEGIAECCAYAREKGVSISLKPHGGFNASGQQCRIIAEQIDEPNFGVWYDPGNIFFYSYTGLDPVDDAPTVNGSVVGVSVKDYQHPRGVALTPGTGMVDFPEVMRILRDGGFTSGPLVVETLKPGTKEELLDEAIKAREFLEELRAELL